MYEERFNHTERFSVTYPVSDTKLVLKVMEAFDRYPHCVHMHLSSLIDYFSCRLYPCSVKMRDLTFLSTSEARESFTSLVCPETVVLSMLFDKNLTVPDNASAVQLEERARPKVSNPVNALSLRKKSKEKKIVDKPQQLWAPRMQLGRRIPSILVCQFHLTGRLKYTNHHKLDLQDAGPPEEMSPQLNPPPPPPPPLEPDAVQDSVENTSKRTRNSQREV